MCSAMDYAEALFGEMRETTEEEEAFDAKLLDRLSIPAVLDEDIAANQKI